MPYFIGESCLVELDPKARTGRKHNGAVLLQFERIFKIAFAERYLLLDQEVWNSAGKVQAGCQASAIPAMSLPSVIPPA